MFLVLKNKFFGGIFMLNDLKGKIQTVTGVIDPDELGFTLMHEHVFIDLTVFFNTPESATKLDIAKQPVSNENIYFVRYHPLENEDNLRLTDEDVMRKEVMKFKEAGGKSLVDMSTIGLHGDPDALSRISRSVGINIIKGTGYYVSSAQTEEIKSKSIDELALSIIKEIEVGFGNTGIKAGIIGEVGCLAPMTEFEKKSLKATAIAQQKTGVMINIHPSYRDDLVLENVKILKEAGADMTHVVTSHADFCEFTDEAIHKLFDMGCCVEFDTFILEGYYGYYDGYYKVNPTDGERVRKIIQLINEGYISQILASTDICYKHFLTKYGGPGYAHMLRNAIPMMRSLGMSNEQINTIFIENPKRMLSIK